MNPNGLPKLKLTGKAKEIVEFCASGRSKIEIFDALILGEEFKSPDIKTLFNNGLLLMIVKDELDHYIIISDIDGKELTNQLLPPSYNDFSIGFPFTEYGCSVINCYDMTGLRKVCMLYVDKAGKGVVSFLSEGTKFGGITKNKKGFKIENRNSRLPQSRYSVYYQWGLVNELRSPDPGSVYVGSVEFVGATAQEAEEKFNAFLETDYGKNFDQTFTGDWRNKPEPKD